MIMQLKDGDHRFLSETCGGIYHCLTKYNDTTISDHETWNLNHYFNVKEKYILKSTGVNSIRIENERVAINYVHGDEMSHRGVIVELKEV